MLSKYLSANQILSWASTSCETIVARPVPRYQPPVILIKLQDLLLIVHFHINRASLSFTRLPGPKSVLFGVLQQRKQLLDITASETTLNSVAVIWWAVRQIWLSFLASTERSAVLCRGMQRCSKHTSYFMQVKLIRMPRKMLFFLLHLWIGILLSKQKIFF